MSRQDIPQATPAVSVIIATYNRCRILRHAVQSVVNSTFTDWELVVVGDACTDKSAECIHSFHDPRIRFVNLPARCGDQSGPNNHGVALSRGRYIAFLNHDDLFLPEHLANCVAELESSAADLVWVPCAVVVPKPDEGPLPFGFELKGVPFDSGYSPFSFYFASSWVLRRSLSDRIGPWPFANQEYVTPSQAWLFRAWRSGAALRFLPTMSVILIPAGARAGSYRRDESPEHEWLATWLRETPGYREQILQSAAIHEARKYITALHHPSLGTVFRFFLRPAFALLSALGIHPVSLRSVIRYGGRGRGVRHHRETTGAG